MGESGAFLHTSTSSLQNLMLPGLLQVLPVVIGLLMACFLLIVWYASRPIPTLPGSIAEGVGKGD